MHARDGFIFLGAGIILTGTANAIPLDCCNSFVALIALAALIAGIIIMYMKREEMGENFDIGAKVAVGAFIAMGILICVNVVIILSMVSAMMSQMGPDQTILADDLLETMKGFLIAMSVVGVITTLALFVMTGALVFPTKKPVPISLQVVGCCLIVLFTIIGAVAVVSIFDDLEDEFGGQELEGSEDIDKITARVNQPWTYALKAGGAVGYILMGSSVIVAGGYLETKDSWIVNKMHDSGMVSRQVEEPEEKPSRRDSSKGSSEQTSSSWMDKHRRPPRQREPQDRPERKTRYGRDRPQRDTSSRRPSFRSRR